MGYDGIYLEPDPLSGVIGTGGQDTAWATNVCDGTDTEVAANWSSSVPAVASIDTNGWVSFQSVGTSTITATAKLQSVENPSCRPQVFQSSAPENALSATVTLRASQQVSASDGASILYKGYVGSLNLGIIAGNWGVNNNGCIAGNELVGSVNPSTFTGSVTVKRKITSEGCYQGPTPVACPAPVGDDTGDWLTTDPQENTPGGSANGNVYNLDAPGITQLKNTSTPVRARFNWTAYAVGPDGTTQISPNVNYFLRISCMNNSSGVAQLQTDASSSDNQIGLGTTNTTWNLQ